MPLTVTQTLVLERLLAIQQGLTPDPFPSAMGELPCSINALTVAEVLFGPCRQSWETRFPNEDDRSSIHAVQVGEPLRKLVRTVREIAYAGPSSWVDRTLARSIYGKFVCAPGKTIYSYTLKSETFNLSSDTEHFHYDHYDTKGPDDANS